MKKIVLGAISLIMLLTISGCSSHHEIKLNKSYIPENNTKVKVDHVINKTGKEHKLDIENMLKVAFEKKLNENNLLANTEYKETISLDVNILEYSEGNAFKRWLVPGWGATTLTIEAKLFSSGKRIGNLKATRNIAAGGGYTIGAWKDVFEDLAADVIEDFRKEFKKQKS